MKQYLEKLCGKIFKLLPMREDADKGVSNHIERYVQNLLLNIEGFLNLYPEVANMSEFVEAHSNIAMLLRNPDLPFSEWRAVVLRTTRLISTTAEKACEEAG